jgi:2-keto-3-deoxy-L-rhamnonate aldolase RhmA
MSDATLKTRMRRGDILAGTFLKTPAHDMVEVLATSGLDFICLDAEHAPFDRARMDACLAVGRAMDFPILVRVPDGTASELLKVLDSGAVGVVVPHVATPKKAADIAKWSRFGHGGRGYAGSSRWAGFATRTMPEILAQSAEETIVIGQIEEPEGVAAINQIAATDGLDGVFVGPADLAVCLGVTDMNAAPVLDAMRTVADAAKRHGIAAMTFTPNAASANALMEYGISTFFIGSDHAFALATAKQIAADVHAIDS